MSLLLLLAASLGSTAELSGQVPPQNGEQLNAACIAAANDRQRAHCVTTALYVMMEFAEFGRGSTEAGGDVKFCLTPSTTVSIEHVEPLIDAFRAQYAREPRAFASVSPYAAFLRVMRREWPCSGGR